jgi:site-specific DNA-methyltransferase (adenine-specific)
LKDDGEFYINTDWRTYPFLYPIAVQSMRVTNCIVWDCEWIKAGSHYRFSHEFIIYGQKTDAQKRKFPATERDVWRMKPINFTQDKNHPPEKPVELVRRMISNSTKLGDIVLDTFLGSGTTAVPAKMLGRKYIGIEISEKYCEIARRRVTELRNRFSRSNV